MVLVALALSFPVADLIQRTVVVGLLRAFPSRRNRVLTKWIRGMAHFSLDRLVGGIGGAEIDAPPSLELGPRTLLLMNHQSLLDIPLAILSVENSFPIIVTRRLYARGIPVVSFMLRLYDFPLVDPGQRSDGQLQMLARVARDADRPILIFPEGHRTRDGELRAFRPAGAAAILETGRWTVHLLVVDGFWRCGELKNFGREVGRVKGHFRSLGPFEFDTERDDSREFLGDMHGRMQRALAELREESADA